MLCKYWMGQIWAFVCTNECSVWTRCSLCQLSSQTQSISLFMDRARTNSLSTFNLVFLQVETSALIRFSITLHGLWKSHIRRDDYEGDKPSDGLDSSGSGHSIGIKPKILSPNEMIPSIHEITVHTHTHKHNRNQKSERTFRLKPLELITLTNLLSRVASHTDIHTHPDNLSCEKFIFNELPPLQSLRKSENFYWDLLTLHSFEGNPLLGAQISPELPKSSQSNDVPMHNGVERIEFASSPLVQSKLLTASDMETYIFALFHYFPETHKWCCGRLLSWHAFPCQCICCVLHRLQGAKLTLLTQCAPKRLVIHSHISWRLRLVRQEFFMIFIKDFRINCHTIPLQWKHNDWTINSGSCTK